MHCVVSMPDGHALGGHFLSAHVSPLLEVFVTADPVALHKKHDDATGLSLMDPGNELSIATAGCTQSRKPLELLQRGVVALEE